MHDGFPFGEAFNSCKSAQPCAPVTQPWYWRSLPLARRTGSEVFAALFRPDSHSEAIATLLESPYPTSEDRSQLACYSICAGAPRIIDGQPQLWTPLVGEILPFLKQLLQREGAGDKEKLFGKSRSAEVSKCFTHHYAAFQVAHVGELAAASPLTTPHSLPFTGGWLGWLGYDLAWEIEKLPHTKSDSLPFPVAYWYEPECFAVLDHSRQVLWLAASAPQQLDELQERLEKSEFTSQNSEVGIRERTTHHSLLTHQEEYETAVRKAKKYIQAGDIFQANLSLRFEASTIASSWQIYQALQQINPSPFASYWQTPWGAVISCSPERLVQLHDRQVQTRPIAGTRSRGVTPAQDCELAQELLSNAKEIAEHVMLVDLERNDLGRVCQWGSVVVDELLAIERYSHVMHLVSNITGTLKPEYNAVDLIRAVFPGGTITGCPKVRCMEIIEELEPVRRNLFYGSCGYLDWRGNLDLNILIRTLLYARQETEEGQGNFSCRGARPCAPTQHDATLLQRNRTQPLASPLSTNHYALIQSAGHLAAPCNTSRTTHAKVWGQVGAGIVADSDPEREWYESLHKAQAQIIALKKAEE